MITIDLDNIIFDREPRVIAENDNFEVVSFVYSTGVKALKVANSRGSFTILPYMGQMIWRCDFDGQELTMKSIYTEPKNCKQCFNESYGCFLMHCGITAMGNPTAEDTHVGHAELPIIPYKSAYLIVMDEKVAVMGKASYDMCFTYNYEFCPFTVLKADSANLEVMVQLTNKKDLPLEYYYLCHVNHRPVDGSKIVESPLAKSPIINHEVPDDYYAPWAKATNKWLDMLDKDYTLQSVVGAKGESYRPEIVNCYFHKPDKQGWATVKQVYPKPIGKVKGVYVKYRPEELPYATRWIARTKDEDAMGMCLPATAEHKGRTYCRAHNQQRYLAPGESVLFHIETGIL